jgi:hypothetical protein
MSLLAFSRAAAVALSVGTFAFLFLNGSWQAGNVFLVPDLVLCALLVIAAVLPARVAVPALTFSFALAAGVLMTAVTADAIAGRLNFAGAFGVLTAVALPLALNLSTNDTNGPAARPATSHE